MKSCLVLGGSGFIASHLVDKLIEEGIKPIIFDRMDNGHIEGSDFMLGDITDAEAVSYAVGHSDVSINLAGILGTAETVDNPMPSAKVNVLGGLNYLQAVREHGKKGVQITVGNHFMNNSYSITKSTTERFALMYNKEHGTRIGIIRALNAYGERQKHEPVRKIVPSFIHRALSGYPIEVYGGKENCGIMDMIYVKDLAQVLFEVLIREDLDYSKVYEAGTGIGYRVWDIAEKIVEITKSSSKVVGIKMRPGEPIKSEVVAKDPYPIKYIGINGGLEKTVPWYEKQYKDNQKRKNI